MTARRSCWSRDHWPLLVALAGLSAFQARAHPASHGRPSRSPRSARSRSSSGPWRSRFSVTTTGWCAIARVLASFVGSLLFAIATYRTAVLSRPAALLLGVARSWRCRGAAAAGLHARLHRRGLACFTLGWLALGVQAIRLDRPATDRDPPEASLELAPPVALLRRSTPCPAGGRGPSWIAGMDYGLILPSLGDDATREGIDAAGEIAERLGFTDVWTTDHLLVDASAAGGLRPDLRGRHDPRLPRRPDARGSASGRASSSSRCATRSSWPRSSRRSTPCRAAA